MYLEHRSLVLVAVVRMLHTKRSAKAQDKLSKAESEMEDERGRRLVGDIDATKAAESPDLDPEDSHRRPLKMEARFRRKSADAHLT